MKKVITAGILCGMILTGYNVAGAVETVYIEHNTEKQFKEGEPNQVVISSEGEISLSYRTEKLLGENDDVWVVNALVRDEQGSLYVATSGRGYIYRLRPGQKPEIIHGKGESDQRHVFSLALDGQGRLLAGTGGEKGRLLRFDESDQYEVLFGEDEIKYLWSIVVGPGGRIYMGTGPAGKVITLDAQGKNPQVLYQAKEKNILSLALDDAGVLYAGGDEKGLIYRIDPGSKQTTIVYDTQHSEISALVFDEEGNLYAATADASAARPGSQLILSEGETSRPEVAQKAESQEQENKADAPAEPEKIEPAQDSEQKPGAKPEKTDKLLPPATNAEASGAGAAGPSISTAQARTTPPGPAKTNEVYKITPQGYVTKLFSKTVVILGMVYAGGGQLLLGTGNDGQLLRLDTVRQEAVVLHEVRPSVQISALVRDAQQKIYVGCANPGQVVAVEPCYLDEGYLVSGVIDAGQISPWGKVQVEADIPASSELLLSSRSGNTSDPDNGGWQEWTDPAGVKNDLPIRSAAGRFLQYKLVLRSADGRTTPVIREVKLAYMTPNLPPKLSNVQVSRAAGGAKPPAPAGKPANPSRTYTISWNAEDDNKDKLTYKIFIRPVDAEPWIRIAQDLEVTQWNFDSLTTADGRYEFKVEASDAAGNAAGAELTDSRISAPVVVDNTPPEVVELSYQVQGRQVKVTAQVEDVLSIIKAVSYSLDSAEQWQTALAGDGIFDSRQERIEFDLKVEQAGRHLLALRFDDALGNSVYRNLVIEITE